MNPFDYVNAINYTKENIMTDDVDEKAYNSFLTNRQLSYFQDTVALANWVNQHHNIDNRLQFDFLLNTVRRRKRFSKWDKPSESEALDVVKEYYGYSNEKAKIALTILTPNQIEELRKRISKGGRK